MSNAPIPTTQFGFAKIATKRPTPRENEMPRQTNHRGHSLGNFSSNPNKHFRKKIEEKYKKYGTLNESFILVFSNASRDGMGRLAELASEILFGSGYEDLNTGAISRMGNGVWGTVEKPKNQHLMAVLIFEHTNLNHLISLEPTLIINPFNNGKFDYKKILPIQTMHLDGIDYRIDEGRKILDLLGLPKNLVG